MSWLKVCVGYIPIYRKHVRLVALSEHQIGRSPDLTAAKKVSHVYLSSCLHAKMDICASFTGHVRVGSGYRTYHY